MIMCIHMNIYIYIYTRRPGVSPAPDSALSEPMLPLVLSSDIM